MNKQFNNVKFTHSRQMCARWTKKKQQNNKNTQIRIHKISTQKIRNNCIKWRWWSRVRVTPTFKLYANEKWALNKTECFSVFFSRLVISLLLFPFYPHWMLWAVFCCCFFISSQCFSNAHHSKYCCIKWYALHFYKISHANLVTSAVEAERIFMSHWRISHFYIILLLLIVLRRYLYTIIFYKWPNESINTHFRIWCTFNRHRPAAQHISCNHF